MKILLAACNAKYIHSNLAVFNLKAYAREYGSRILLREYTINQQKDDILKDIYPQPSGCGVCVLLYLEYHLCEGTDAGSAKDTTRGSYLGRRTGGIL